GADVTAWKDMTARLEPSHPLWGNVPPDANLHSVSDKLSSDVYAVRGFYNINLHAVPVSLGAWPSDEGQRIVGSLVRLWAYHHARSVLPVILLRGVGERQAKEFVEKLMQEIADVDKYRACMMLHMWSSRKI
ncbi:hypothetical protein FRC09_004585, partial [Ceratobasidium sp. 395]